jgi:hypothetical protein
MSIDFEAALVNHSEVERMAKHIAYIMAVFSTIFAFLYLLGLVGKLIVDGTVHSTSSQGVQSISAIIAILLDLSLVILFTGMRRLISGKDSLFADLAVVFITLTCATSSINWFVQLAILPKIVQGGNSTMIALLDIHNTSSLMYAMEHLGWGIFYGLGLIFMGVAFGSGKLESWIRWLSLLGGSLSIIHVFGIIAGSQVMGDLGYIAWGVFLPFTTFLLAILMKRKILIL